MHPNQNPKLDDPALLASLEAKVAQLKADLAAWAAELPAITLANSLGAEDMVLTDVIATSQLPIEIFSLDTGRLPLETYDLMARVQQHYGLKLKFYYPRHEAVEAYTREHGINAFYGSVELRKACCHARKVEPLGRALAGKQAWITGLRAQQSTTRTDLPKRELDAGNGLVGVCKPALLEQVANDASHGGEVVNDQKTKGCGHLGPFQSRFTVSIVMGRRFGDKS